MSALAILETGLMLGLYVLLAGAWGGLYALAHLRKTRVVGHSATAAYGLHALTALIIILGTPLGAAWKCLIAGSSLVIFGHTTDDLALPPAWSWVSEVGMIGNLVNVLLGLWLAYSAIFAHPAGDMNIAYLAVSAVAVIAFAAWARRIDPMHWPSDTNLVLGAALLVVAAARWAVYVPPLLSFWILLLIGITIAIVAMWSMLYRPDMRKSPA